MKLYILVNKRTGEKKAIVEKTYAEALARAKWKDTSVFLIETHIIDEFKINPDIWKQPKPTTPNRIKVK